MFVSVILDMGGIDSAKKVSTILSRYGFNKVQRACWESKIIDRNQLLLLKRELDSVTDYYDIIRIYQFPINNKFVITELCRKKWKKMILSDKNKKGIL